MNYDESKNELEREELELKNQLEEIRKKKESLSKVKPILINEFILDASNGTFTFKVSDYRIDVIDAIKGFRTWNPSSRLNIANVGQLDNILNAVKDLVNVTVEISEEARDLITKWTPLPDIEISLDNFGDFVYKYNKYNAKWSGVEHIRGTRHQSLKSTFIIPKSRGLELYNIVTSSNTYSVRWSQKALDKCEQVIARNKLLNTIATKEVSTLPEELQWLDGHKLMPFQAITLEFAIATDGRMLIQHQMGLGKTPCALAYAEYLRKELEKEGKRFTCIILVPAAAKPNWVSQLMKFTGQLPFKLGGVKPSKADMEEMYLRKHNYYLINYDPISDSYVDEIKHTVNEQGIKVETKITGSAWIQAFNLCQPDLYIIDEAHYLKNASSKRTQAVNDLDTEGKGILLLTGTSITNRPNDLHSLLWLIDKEVAGSRESFINRYFDKYSGVKNAQELKEILKPIAFRKKTTEVLKELEPIRRITREYEPSPAAMARYTLALEGVFQSLEKWDGSPKSTQSITSILTMLLRCKQILAQDKLLYSVDLAKELVTEGEEAEAKYNKCIIFSQFVNDPAPVCRDIHTELNQGNESLLVIGDDSPEKRFEIIKEFQENPDKKYLVCSIHAASESLNITAAGHIIFNDLVWTPATHHQAEGRAYGRLNDPHSIDAYYIICPNTIEDQIWDLLEKKLRIFKEVIEDAEAERDPSIAMTILQTLREMRRMM